MAQLIQLEPVPNKWGMLLSHIGDLESDDECEQTIEFPVRVVKRRHSYHRLATGEILEDLEGSMSLYRGKKQSEDGEVFLNAITYIESFDGDEESLIEGSSASFQVSLYLNSNLFDQIVTLCCASRLPWISLGFDLRGPITYGDSPDGSDKIWKNKEYPSVSIESATIAIPIADQIDKEDNEDM